jgi:hypothetical protein
MQWKPAARRPIVGAAILLFAAFLAPGAMAADGGFSDTSIGFRYGPDFSEPAVVNADGSSAQIGKRIVNLTHVDGSASGGNLLVVDALFSNDDDPDNDGNDGAREVYLIYRHSFASNALFGRHFAFGPVRDTDIVAGFDLNTKDTDYAPRKRMFVLGPQFQIAVPKGFFAISLLAEREYDHNGIVGRAENFDTTWAVESAWMAPFSTGAVPTQFEGYLNFYGPKGRNDFGDPTRTETLFHPRLMFDLGSLAGHKDRFYAGVGYEFWYNKFGADHELTQGAIEHTWLVEAACHF